MFSARKLLQGVHRLAGGRLLAAATALGPRSSRIACTPYPHATQHAQPVCLPSLKVCQNMSVLTQVKPLAPVHPVRSFATRVDGTTPDPEPAAPSAGPAVASPLSQAQPQPQGLFRRILKALKLDSPQRIVVADPEKAGFKRGWIVPAAVFTQLSLGSVFAWSLFNQPLTHLQGVVAPAAADWTLSQIMPVFSTTMAVFGVGCAVFGRLGLYEKLGPRVTGLLGAGLYAAALSTAALAASTHSLPLLYLGYGVLAGTTMGIAYVPPISTLIKWFPDRKGFASALAVMGFGAGGMAATPLIDTLLKTFREAPQFLGPVGSVPTTVIDGKMFATIVGENGATTLQEVVVATTGALTKLGLSLPEGIYAVGTGSTGLASVFLTLGATYAALIGLSALVFRLPPDGYTPKTTIEQAGAAGGVAAKTAVIKHYDYKATGNVSAATTWSLPQFWLVWAGMCLNSTAAYAMIGAGKTMLIDVFGSAYPAVVTAAFAATFVSFLSAFNLGGRLAWGALSDMYGTRKIFMYLWGLGVPLYLAMPLATKWLSAILETNGGPILEAASMLDYGPLALFYASVMIFISTFGGSAAVCPAYVADLFGGKNVAAIHGQILSFLIVGGYLGPMTCSALRARATEEAIRSLAKLVDPAVFEQAFGVAISELDSLIAAKTVTISRLLELAPPGTPDPSLFIYDTTAYALAGFQLLGFLCNVAIKRVDPKKYEQVIDVQGTVVSSTSETSTAPATIQKSESPESPDAAPASEKPQSEQAQTPNKKQATID